MDLLQVSPFEAYPPTFGGQERVHGLVVAHGDDTINRVASRTLAVGQLQEGGQVDRYEIWPGYTETVYNSLLLSIFNKGVRTFGGPEWYYGAQTFHSTLISAISKHPLHNFLDSNPDLVMVEHPWMVKYVSDQVECPVVYSSHNVESNYFDSLSESDTTWLRDRVFSTEQQALEVSDLVITTCDRDAKLYQEMYGNDGPYFVAPNAADMPATDVIEITPNAGTSSPIRACFVGSDAGPNVEAAHEIMAIAQELQNYSNEIKFDIIGTVSSEFTDPVPDNVTLHGFVEDIDGLLSEIDVGLNPVTSGAGTNVKVPMYLAHGLAVVTTPFGSRGIRATADNEPFLVWELDEFSRILTDIADGSVDIAVIARNGRKLAEDKLNWHTVSERLFNELRMLC